MTENIVADTSFYLCYHNDIRNNECLNAFLDSYSFYLGSRILSELPKSLVESDNFLSVVNFNDESFFELIKPFFGRSTTHENDGEYEAIGLAYHLNLHFGLKYLIIDDGRAYKFVASNFKSLEHKLTRNIGFIVKSYKEDSVLSLKMAIEILESIKLCVQKAITEGSTSRPCSADPKVCREILIPLIQKLKDEYECC
ncbi:MAG: hypothetical protein QM426_03155 [Euryarchaeota archaeon]|nr:hypothetical protein [Euryarchaeota archaeon]